MGNRLNYKRLDSKTKTIVKNLFASFSIKGLSLIVSLLTTPAFISFFGDNKVLGIWYTLLSVFSWFLNFDLGIGNGLRNNLVENLSSKDYDAARNTISSGVVSTGFVASILTAVGALLIFTLDLNKLFNISDDIISIEVLRESTLLVFASIMIRFFLSSITSIFYAIQKPFANNLLALLVSVLQLCFVLLFSGKTSEESLLMLSFAFLIISNIPTIVAAIIVFNTALKKCKPKLKYVTINSIKKIMGLGIVFFTCQFFYMIIMNTNSFLITNRYGSEYTTEYEFYYKLTGLISMIITLAISPVWSMVTKAMSERDYNWLKKLYKFLKYVGFFTILLQFMFIPFEQKIMNLWLGEDSIQISILTAISFACFGSCFVYSSILSSIVCGLSRMKIQAIMYSIGSLAKIIGVFFLSKIINDWSLVVWSNVAVLLPYCIVQQIDLELFFKKIGRSQEKSSI